MTKSLSTTKMMRKKKKKVFHKITQIIFWKPEDSYIHEHDKVIQGKLQKQNINPTRIRMK
ncbi:CLUMA_CG016776, isoform A [Clunio marinus]|uniref:CLUMA_CG016776, isoform A n=1 Tax=Clunio marinus TaxID=568069 RepID=A0A1J1ISG5_9DIPT|nr:CLUMA_CG016776, isoform A [Clunio marinus]